MTIRDGELRMATSSFTLLLSSDPIEETSRTLSAGIEHKIDSQQFFLSIYAPICLEPTCGIHKNTAVSGVILCREVCVCDIANKADIRDSKCRDPICFCSSLVKSGQT